MDELQQRIHNTTFSLDVAHRRVGLVQQLLEDVVFQDASSASVVERYQAEVQAIESKEDRAALEEWGTDWVSSMTARSAASNFKRLREWLTSVGVADVSLPVATPDSELAPLAAWCRAELQSPLFLQVTVDANMVGGCGVVQNGVFHDLSLAGRLQTEDGAVEQLIEQYVTT